MQNEELQHVIKLSDQKNHEYNGFLLSNIADRSPTKSKRLSPKKKFIDMVTANSNTIVRRRSQIKKSKVENSTLNGVCTGADMSSVNKEQRNEKLHASNLNHRNNVSLAESPFDTLGTTFSNLNKFSDPNHEMDPSTAKYADNQTGRSDVSTHVNYSIIQSIYAIDTKLSIDKVPNQKVNNLSTDAQMKRLEELKSRNIVYSNYLTETSCSRTTSNSQYESFVDRIEDKKGDTRKLIEKEVEKTPRTFFISRNCESKLFLKAKRRRQRRRTWQMDSGTHHEALQRIRECVDLHRNIQNDLFPLNLGETNYDQSDSDSTEEQSTTFQNHWFHSMCEIEFDDVKRNLRLGQLYSELRRQLYQIKQNKSQLPTLSENFMKSLVNEVRTQPSDVVRFLYRSDRPETTRVEPIILTKRKCAVDNCKNVALPCMPTCVRHVLLCDKQTLFEQCRVRDSNNFQCDKCVVNIKYHYPVCSLHSKPEFVLPDFLRDEIKYEDVRRKHVSTTSATTYETDINFLSINTYPIINAPTSSEVDSKKQFDSSIKTREKLKTIERSQFMPEKKEKEIRPQAECKENKVVKQEPVKLKAPLLTRKTHEKCRVGAMEEETTSTLVPESNRNIFHNWVDLSGNQLVDVKTLQNSLHSDFVNGFDINSTTIQSQIQGIINSESSLPTDILLGPNELPNYVQVEEIIEEVEITDETLDSAELGNQELVHSEDINAVLKQLPPEAFNELFSEFTLSEG